jgi:DNA-binding MarR family transcriptional regulator
MPVRSSQVPDTIGDLASRIRDVVRRLRQRLLSESQTDGITPSQWSVLLALLEKPEWTQTELAARDHVRPQSIGTTVATLEGLGLVDRRSHARDGRRVLIGITPAGRRLVDDTRLRINSWLAAMLAGELSAPERDQLTRALPLLERLIDAD